MPIKKHHISLTKQNSNSDNISKNANRTDVRVRSAKGRKISSTMWLHRQLNDPFVKSAKIEGYLSRAAYKLLEIDQKYHIFQGANYVLDLGAAPGSWMQVAWSHLKNKDAVLVGLDLAQIIFSNQFTEQCQRKPVFILGDFRDLTVQDLVKKCAHKYDLIMSDMSPNRTGSNTVDHLSLVALLEEVEKFAEDCMSANGTLLIKMLQGSEQHEFTQRLKKKFKKVQYIKPRASRANSMEVYILARHYHQDSNQA